MIPYIDPPVFGHLVSAWQLTAAAALITGYFLVRARAKRLHLDTATFARAAPVVVAAGLLGAYALKLALYHGTGVSSFGGMFAGLAAILVLEWRWRRGSTLLEWLDAVAWAWPFAWSIARAGCALMHDHPGIPSTSWLAVRFPDGPRFDLGLIEMLFSMLVAGLFLMLDRQPRAPGFWFGTLCILFGGFRSALDRLHESSPQLLGIAPDLAFGVLLACVGLCTLTIPRRRSVLES